ncbi:MAG: mechanosensitive ion channel [Deltaproteobacteria bacterium]|nr:mechanosensitive ion channel [Deltaproteobacteria bacterium]
MENLPEFLQQIISFLNVPLVTFGESTLTIWVIIYLLIILILLVYVTAKLKNLIIHRLLAKSNIEVGVRVAVASLVRYIILFIGFIIILQTAGINLSSITVLFGALGVGIGFGLQNITNNFVSGLIILIERPVKVGDRIEVSGISGDVVNISMRATTIITNDNISIIIPNSEFVSSTVINWSHTDRSVRFNFPVGVAYKEDPQNIKKLLLQVADENDGVLKKPRPDVLFSEFADSALIFNLRVWTREYTDRPGVLKSQLYYEIHKKFKENGVEIPFPQHDIHIKENPAHHSQE